MIDGLFLITGEETSQLLSEIVSPKYNESTFSIPRQDIEGLQSIDLKKVDLKLADSRFVEVESEAARSFLDSHRLALKERLLYFDTNCFSLIYSIQAESVARIDQDTGNA